LAETTALQHSVNANSMLHETGQDILHIRCQNGIFIGLIDVEICNDLIKYLIRTGKREKRMENPIFLDRKTYQPQWHIRFLSRP
jgi:hypothetical protein